jgi:hypothetical protein
MGTRVVHCWAEGPDTDDGCGQTCMLLDGHLGPHEWTRDDEITLQFPRAGDDPETPDP